MAKSIVCPYCAEIFDNTEAMMQCDNPDASRCPRVNYIEFNTFWKVQGATINRVWAQKFGFFSKKPNVDKSVKCPNCNYASLRYVCPECLNRIPKDMVRDGAEIISVIGSPSSGKTNYIVSLINELENRGYNLSLSVVPSDIKTDAISNTSTQMVYNDLRNQLFKDKNVLAKTPVGSKNIPWIFRLYQQTTDKAIYLVFYDTPGESFAEDLKNSTPYLANSSGIIVILDPLSIENIQKTMKDKEWYTEGMCRPAENLMGIQTAFKNFMQNLEGDTKENILASPIAFVMSKFDVILDHKKDFNDFSIAAFEEGGKRKNSSYRFKSSVDINRINDISATIESLLPTETWDAGYILNFAHDWASKKNLAIANVQQRDAYDEDNNYKFFGVSAFGHMPDDMDQLDKIEPYRVMDPLVWILYKLGTFDIPTD